METIAQCYLASPIVIIFILFFLQMLGDLGLFDSIINSEEIKDRRQVVERMGWKIYRHRLGRCNHGSLMTMRGWETIKDLNPQAARSEHATYVYADGSVYFLSKVAEPKVRVIVDRLVNKTEANREITPELELAN